MRVGLATGKALAQALRVPMIGISSLDLLAFPHRQSDRVVVPVIDARKGEVFYAMYRAVPGGVQQVVGPRVAAVDELVADLVARSQDTLCVGDGALRYRREICAGFHCEFADEAHPERRRRSSNSPTPGRCARSGSSQADIHALYLRPPDADINWATRAAAGHGGAEAVSILERMLDRAVSRPVVIEPMRIRHVGQIMAIERNAYPRPWSANVFHDELREARDGRRHYVVAKRGRAVIGYGGIMFVPGRGTRRRDADDAARRTSRTSPCTLTERRSRRGDAAARRARRRGDPTWLRGVDVGGSGDEPSGPRSCTAASASSPRACARSTTRTTSTPS